MQQCNSRIDASGMAPRLNQLNASAGNDVNLLLRGTIATFDAMLDMTKPCLPNPEAQQLYAEYAKQRDAALRTCRQISSSDNCLVSPF